ncbi:MAG TPA: CYTH and CHAD domain-containing protein [Burkholderiaceae bacterium]|nr:CYTH and CHAD domain-containing protein [Burkholderiaceae bacterium]
MQEIEIKLQVPAARRAEVEAAVAGRTPGARVRLQAWYHDCADRRLAAGGLALRLRREGRRWVQTLKGAGDDGLTRAEHNVPRGAAAAMPTLDPALHAGTPVGERLLALLTAAPSATLEPLYRTDIRRRARVRPVRWPGGPSARVELAFDRGRIEAGARVLEVSELEIELLAGAPRAVIETARRWGLRHGLWLDLRSKAERGDLLARGETVAPARSAQPLKLDVAMSAAQAWQAVLRNCADQILANASQIASGAHDAEHVHQLRVGLRRLRSALALFEPADASAALGGGASALFRQLGAARDRVVIEGEFAAALRAAMREAGVANEAPVPAASDTEAAPPELLRLHASQSLLLDLIEAMHPGAGAEAGRADALSPLRDRMAARLNHWHRQVVADAKHYVELDDAQRHRLRKRAKRLRYATEFCGALFERRAVRRYLKALRDLQERLGAVSDTTMAMCAFAPRADTEPAAMFALGWLAARRAALVAASGPELKRFAKVRRYWKETRG